jgi:hypothetical protein
MFMRKRLLSSAGRSVAMATVAVLVVTMSEPPLAIAGPAAPASKGVSATTASSDATDFSARRRYYRGGSAAGLAFMGLAIGTIGAIAAQQQYYNSYGYYGGGPYYYGGGPYYYGGGPYYGRRYYYVPY